VSQQLVVREAKKFKASVKPRLLSKISSYWERDKKELKLPSYRRLFSKHAPKTTRLIYQFCNELYPDANHLRNRAENSIMLYMLGDSCVSRCSICTGKFFWGSYCSAKCSTQAAHTPEATAKRIKTNMRRYGGPTPMSSPKIQKKISRIYHAKSETDRRAIVKRRERTSLKKYGVHNAGGTEESLSKARKTWMQKCGVPSPLQSSEIFQRAIKSGYRKRWVRFKDGTRLIIQSKAEQFVVRKLLKQGWKVEAPDFSIPYTLGGNRHRYHPDFVVSKGKKKRLIEVKSTYTLEKDLRKNLQKFRSANKFCEQRGMKFIVCILSGAKILQRLISPTKAEVLSSIS